MVLILELNVHLSGPKASDLPWLFEGSTSQDAYFIDEGIELKFNGGIRQASLESAQSDMFSFIINSVDISASALTIADFLYQKIKNRKNAKTRVGSYEIKYDINPDELRKIIREELERLRDGSGNPSNR